MTATAPKYQIGIHSGLSQFHFIAILPTWFPRDTPDDQFDYVKSMKHPHSYQLAQILKDHYEKEFYHCVFRSMDSHLLMSSEFVIQTDIKDGTTELSSDLGKKGVKLRRNHA
ncbi:hypothetical protein BDW42DRAFT_131670 [Aspergillus taichungensis]|uniref:Uncharacterized protein n=1 Tax=Aspergillus taichungensis TaxID=482145 RepID=A0A2J5I6Z6_9EURO|nr:hypothetical protein BDW42DRAFT_131670 [Aspergillus taichungensis]